MTQSDAPNEGEKSINNPVWHIKVLKERLQESEKQYQELSDQLSKERETNSELRKRIDTDWYVVSLRKDIEKERKMRKELVDGYVSLLDSEEFQHHFSTTAKEIKSLISRASELDKNQ